MKCPACENVLTLMVAGDITVNVCEMGCGGMWFDAFEFEKVDEPHESAGEALLQVERNPNGMVDTDAKRPCPKCEGVAMQRHFASVKKRVEVDECPGCGGVWLDAGELADIRDQFPSDEERRQAAEAYYDEIFGSELSAMRGRNEAAREKVDRIARLFRFICPSYYVPGKQKWGAF